MLVHRTKAILQLKSNVTYPPPFPFTFPSFKETLKPAQNSKNTVCTLESCSEAFLFPGWSAFLLFDFFPFGAVAGSAQTENKVHRLLLCHKHLRLSRCQAFSSVSLAHCHGCILFIFFMHGVLVRRIYSFISLLPFLTRFKDKPRAWTSNGRRNALCAERSLLVCLACN